jgi:tape measure domain-containing protein
MSKVIEYVLSLKDKLSGALNTANDNVNKFENKLKGVQGTANQTGSVLGKMVGAFSVAGAIAGAYKLGETIIKAGANMEQTRVQFETFTGSAKKGNEVIAQLQKFSLATPFDDEQVLKAGKSLLAFGVGTDELQSKLSQIGNISSATGKDFNELTTIYGKAKTAGTLYAEDINQLVEAGIPIIDEFAKQLGVPTSQVKKLASQGKISFGMLEKGFDNLGGKAGKWGELMDKQSKTLAGKWSSLVGYMQNLLSGIGEGQIPFLNTIVDKFGEILNWVKDSKGKIGEMFTPLTNAVKPLLTSFGKVYDALGLTGSTGDVLNGVFAKIGYTFQLLAPFIETTATVIGKVYESVAQVITIFSKWFKTNKEAQSNLIVFYNAFKTIFGAIGDIAGKVLGGIVKTIDGIINKDFSKIGSGLKDIVLAPVKVAFDKNTYKDLNANAPKLTNFFAPTKSVADTARDASTGTKASLTKPGATGAADAKKALSTKVGDVAGTKPVNINITIQKLTGIETLHTTNIKESFSKMGESVKQEMLAALTDFSLLAPQ